MTTVLNKILWEDCAVDLHLPSTDCAVVSKTFLHWPLHTQLFVQPDRVVGKIRHVRPGGKRLIVAAKRRPERSLAAPSSLHTSVTRARARRGGALPGLHPCPSPPHPIGPPCRSRSPRSASRSWRICSFTEASVYVILPPLYCRGGGMVCAYGVFVSDALAAPTVEGRDNWWGRGWPVAGKGREATGRCRTAGVGGEWGGGGVDKAKRGGG